MLQKYLILQWHITERCERRCAHCYMYDNKTYKSSVRGTSDMVLDHCFKAINQFVQLCKKLSSITGIRFLPRFIISGGDPLLHPDFFAILKEVNKHDDFIEILGNGDKLDYDTVSKLYDCGVRKYQISLDGTKKTHDGIRGAGSFESAINGLRLLSKVGIKTGVMSSVFKGNMSELCDLINSVAKDEADSFSFSRVASFGNARDLDSAIKPLEYRDLLGRVHNLQKSLQVNNCRASFPLKDHLWKPFLYEKGEYRVYPHFKKNKTGDGCHMGQSFMVLLSDGVVLACRRFYSPIGKFPEQSLSNIFLYSKEMSKFRSVRSLKKCSKCALLYYCRGCPAVAHGYHGDWKGADPQCWFDFKGI